MVLVDIPVVTSERNSFCLLYTSLLADAVDTRNILYIGLEKPLQTAEFFKKNMRERVGIPTGDRIKKQKLQSFMVFKSARSFLQIPFFQPRTMSLMDRNKAVSYTHL